MSLVARCWIAPFVMLILCSVSAVTLAQGEPSQNEESIDSYKFTDPNQRQIFLSLTAELRCPMCQNQNIADSDAMISHDMRRKVYQLLQAGNTEQQVIDYMKARYGDFVYYQPPVTPYTLWLWLLPIVFVVIALFFVSRKPNAVGTDDVESKLAQADELLRRED